MPRAVILMNVRNKKVLNKLDTKLKMLGYETNARFLTERFELDGHIYPRAGTIACLTDDITHLDYLESNNIVLSYMESNGIGDATDIPNKIVFNAIATIARSLNIPIKTESDLTDRIVCLAMERYMEDQNAETQIPVPGESDEWRSTSSSKVGGSDSGSEQSGSNEPIDSSAEKESERGSESSVEADR